MTPAPITITNADLTARIDPFGAELLSLTDAAGNEYMTDADPAFWSGHAPILFPIVGSLVDGRMRLDGQDYAMDRHGFARHSRFTATKHTPDAVTLRLTDSAETREHYPFAFTLDLAFRLSGPRLDMIATVTNPGDAPLPFSFGYHPAFAWPLPGGADKAAHRLTFDQPEPQDIRRVAPGTGVLLPASEPTPVRGRDLTLSPDLFTTDAVIWTDLASRALTYHAPGGAALHLEFPDTPMLGLWQVPGARYICIEPWQGHSDPAGFAGDFTEKPGLVLLPPGQAKIYRLSVTIGA